MGGNRFWEFYLVRYLLGTIFGIVILFYLVINYNQAITKAFFCQGENQNTCVVQQKPGCEEGGKAANGSKKEQCNPTDSDYIKNKLMGLLFDTTYGINMLDANTILNVLGSEKQFSGDDDREIQIKETGFPILAAIILAIAGFLYMYFSSMIILILHGARSTLFLGSGKKVFYIMITFLILLFFIYNAENNILRHVNSIAILLLVIVLFLGGWPSIKMFYKQLSAFRAVKKDSNKEDKVERKIVSIPSKVDANHRVTETKTLKKQSTNEGLQKERKEYIESYKHLREHGNAFGIIVCELLFAFWLVSWNFSFWAILYWCTIGFLSWLLGTYLEVYGVKEE